MLDCEKTEANLNDYINSGLYDVFTELLLYFCVP